MKPSECVQVNLKCPYHWCVPSEAESHLDPVPLCQLHEDRLTRHAVLVIVDVILIKQRRHLHSIPPDGCQDLLHVVCADVEGEHVTTCTTNITTHVTCHM